jgi:glycosyltransferase involved in cell wall biosynthesis
MCSVPILSICVPTYNRCELLNLALQNLIQVCTGKETFVEIVISDNASTDFTEKLLAEYGANHENIKTFRQPKNIGSIANCFYLVQNMAKGKYCWLVGDDDCVMPEAVGRILGVLAEYPDLSVMALNHFMVDILDRNSYIEGKLGCERFLGSKNMSSCPTSGLLENAAKVIEKGDHDFRFMTHISAQVFRRQDWCRRIESHEGSTVEQPFASVECMYPHLIFFMEQNVNRSVWFEAPPAIAVGIGSQEWADSWMSIVLKSHDLLKFYRTIGVCPNYIHRTEENWMRLWSESLIILTRKLIKGNEDNLLILKFVKKSFHRFGLLTFLLSKQIKHEIIMRIHKMERHQVF